MPWTRRVHSQSMLGRSRQLVASAVLIALVGTTATAQWVQFTDQTSLRLVADPAVGTADVEEKDYAWGDVDNDGDTDIVCVRKQPFTTAGRRGNILFLNEGIAEGHAVNGVLVDRTDLYMTASDVPGDEGFNTPTNDRDVVLSDVNRDGWLDIITAPTLSDGQPKHISHPRVYINLGETGGVWQGFRYEDGRFPQLLSIPDGTPAPPRFCSVDEGDVSGDNYPDLYFGDYDSGPQPHTDMNDRLLINDGNGFFADQSTQRMTSEMLLSAFGTAVVIADMNRDGVNDIVKDTALNPPQRISISYNNPANEGLFNQFDIIYEIAPYFISVDDLNQDGNLDIVITDDGADRYFLNQGNDGSNMATFSNSVLLREVGTDGEFGSNSIISDLNNDGHKDVIVCDVDVDGFGCARQTHIYRNLGDLPNITLQEQGTGNIPPAMLVGVHDIAVFDINGDGWDDMFIGRCNSTEVWINQPPTGLAFTYPQGLPAFVTPNQPFTFQVQIDAIGGGTLDTSSAQMTLSVDGGFSTVTPLNHLGGGLYEATLPADVCSTRFSFYFSAALQGGGTTNDPSDAPIGRYNASVAEGTAITFSDDIEGDVSGWSIVSDASLTSGAWEQADPNGTFSGATPAAPDDDATQAASAVQAFVTENAAPGATAGAADVDGGPTHLITPTFALAGTDATISWQQWFFSASGTVDTLDVYVTNTPGDADWVLALSTDGTDGWESASFTVSDFVTPSDQVRVRFTASDSPNNSITEAGIDNVQVQELICAGCTNESCDDGLYCNGAETCQGATCTAGSSPCNFDEVCDEANDTCVDCLDAGDCDDGLFCNGAESCGGNTCGTGSDPCPGQLCDEASDACVDCLGDGDCDDGDDCNGIETCSGGMCQVGSALDCDDGLFCNGVESCAAGSCVAGTSPCSGFCDEDFDSCTLALQPRMGQPVRGLSPEDLDLFTAGLAEFNRDFDEGEGLGPIFNQDSCGSCHAVPAVGGSGTIQVMRFGQATKSGFDPLDSLGGSLLQFNGLSAECFETVPPQANVMTNRLTPSIFGGGLIEAISDADLLENVSSPPSPAVSGIAHMVEPLEDIGGTMRVGRFGWKAQVATILTFAGDAALNEMGITNRLVPNENAPNGDMVALAACDAIPDPEDGPDGEGFHFIDRITHFQRMLAAPPQTPRSGMTGEQLFINIGCADCHIADSFNTGITDIASLSDRTIKPYSDFLLHDMGALGDGIVQGAGTEREMRTPALWGVRIRDVLLHDARVAGGTFSSRIVDAVAEHGGEGALSAANFAALSVGDQDAVIAFLDSLGRAEFDHDGDNVVEIPDFVSFHQCYDEVVAITPDDPCAISDFDQNGDVDAVDYEAFLLAFDGLQEDCNGNSVLDLTDILDGTSLDADLDGRPDECSAFCGNDCDCTDADVCSVNICSENLCDNFAAPRYGDIEEPFVGQVQTSDILCGVAGFGNYCSCPNADLAGCSPSGIPIGTNDILALVDAFGGADPCGCGVTPGPTAASGAPIESVVAGPAAEIRLIARQAAAVPGGTIAIDAFVSNADGLRSYELALDATAGRGLDVSVAVKSVDADRLDYVFAGMTALDAKDDELDRLGSVSTSGAVSVAARERRYLGTFTLNVPDKAAGVLRVSLRMSDTAMWASSIDRLAIDADGGELLIPISTRSSRLTNADAGRRLNVR